MLNGKFVNDSAKTLAERIRKETAKTSKQIAFGLKLILSRTPSNEEIKAAINMLEDIKASAKLSEKDALDQLCLACSQPERIFIPRLIESESLEWENQQHFCNRTHRREFFEIWEEASLPSD